MGMLSNWKQGRQARIDAAKARKAAGGSGEPGKVVMDTSKVDPRAKEFLDYTASMLEEHGVTSQEIRDQCCYDLLETMKKSFRATVLDPGADQDRFLMKMADSINTAGIKDEKEQEDIIIQFLAKFKRIGGF